MNGQVTNVDFSEFNRTMSASGPMAIKLRKKVKGRGRVEGEGDILKEEEDEKENKE